MNSMSKMYPPAEDRDAILDDLIDLLWTEDIAGIRSRVVASGQTDHVNLFLGKREITIHLQPDGWRSGLRPSYVTDGRTGKILDPSELLWTVLDTLPNLDLPVLDRTMKQLRQSEKTANLVRDAGAELSLAAKQAGALKNALLWERIAAWRDRPFSPFSHSRGNWDASEIKEYGAEFGRYFALRWCAVDKNHLLPSPCAKEGGPSAAILDTAQYNSLRQELADKGIDKTHEAIPLHPWQADNVIPREFSAEITTGQVAMLEFRGPIVAATSSLRSVAIPSVPGCHLKLPLDVETLGVRRLLSAQSLYNGLKGAELLASALANRTELGQIARIVDESQFWTFSESSGDIFADRTAYLGCALRRFPLKEQGHLVPLAAFAVAPAGGIPPAIEAALAGSKNVSLDKFIYVLFDLLAGFAIEALGCGFIPEMHGQNVLVEISEGLPCAIVLRDHDTVRCHPEILAKSDLPKPEYLIKDPRRATMFLSRAEDLFAFGQTLLFDVALRAIATELDQAGAFNLSASRKLLRASIKHHVERAKMPEELRHQLRSAMLKQSEWPFKQILTPLLHTKELGLGMPSRLGRAGNPFCDVE